jgi:alpha-beta hydrolase superfamily lysophospholipase
MNTFTAPTGQTVHYKQWADPQDIKAVVLLVHGLGEHIGRYEHVAAHFHQLGYAFIAYDQYGHGKTTGKVGHVRKMDDILDLLDKFIAFTQSLYPGKAICLYGHSMGGLIVLTEAARRSPEVKAVIATAPAIRLAFQPPAFILALGKLMRKLYPAFSQKNQLDVKQLSHDQKVIDAYVADPLVHDIVNAELGIGLIEWGNTLADSNVDFKMPILIMHGSNDKITSAAGSEAFAQKSKGNVNFKLWPGLFHEIHNEPEQDDVLSYASNWLGKQL